ncbi:uncharacterized protein LOC133839399 [Drosophila sulfurigaster albostrigata]|uniref:uncharacterized protein LOC133839399 n=1 Tax=Drosophila sulfurigaster albostrigata TaxID=89887 RepID=UPI002D21EDDF|nr:uncharacterized protein LOC133839399 [Drosophila sulfurigaster albostrigata]
MHSSIFGGVLLVFLTQINGTMIYPELTLTPLTILCAFGIPVKDLAFETVISGYALRMQYFLPNNASQSLTDRRHKGGINLGSTYRWIVYRGIEMVLQPLGVPGHECLLRVICEHAAIPLTHESGLLGELLHIILTPSSSMDTLGVAPDRVYQTAERVGSRGGNCDLLYASKCPRSPMNLISILLKVNK